LPADFSGSSLSGRQKKIMNLPDTGRFFFLTGKKAEEALLLLPGFSLFCFSVVLFFFFSVFFCPNYLCGLR
jgi:hypothetical protein